MGFDVWAEKGKGRERSKLLFYLPAAQLAPGDEEKFETGPVDGHGNPRIIQRMSRRGGDILGQMVCLR
jgi:hypothetical protein